MKFKILFLIILSFLEIYTITINKRFLINIIHNELNNTSFKTNGDKVIEEGMKLVGKYPYSFGGGNIHGPTLGHFNPHVNHCNDTNVFGFDCGGFVLYTYYQALGIKLPHGPQLTYNKALKENRIYPFSNVKPGDLIYYYSNKVPNSFRHVALYAGNGMMLQSEGHFNPSCNPKYISYQPLNLDKLADKVARFWD